MSRLRGLLHVAYPSNCNTQQKTLHGCRAVAQHTQHTQHPHQTYTLGQKEELTHLVSLVADFHQFSDDDRQEALDTALNNPTEAIICFTSLAKKAGLLKYLKGKKAWII